VYYQVYVWDSSFSCAAIGITAKCDRIKSMRNSGCGITNGYGKFYVSLLSDNTNIKLIVI
jgi:sugar phosphate permease